MKTKVTTDKAPAALGPYSQALVVDGPLYASGQLGIDPATGETGDAQHGRSVKRSRI